VLRSTLALPVAAALGHLLPTPECAEADDLSATSARTEGPYWKPRSPTKSTLVETGMRGTRVVLAGRVLTTRGAPVPKAVLDVWHADADGVYDMRGWRLRGRLAADAEGRFALPTILPGTYPGRTPHVHVKVAPPRGRVLTTQLFFPDQPGNRGDRLYHPRLLVSFTDTPSGMQATFDFVLALA
jgi:protocatechuate 3,4-dioxygenase beta subunit